MEFSQCIQSQLTHLNFKRINRSRNLSKVINIRKEETLTGWYSLDNMCLGFLTLEI